MKILYVIPTLNRGGAERILLDIVSELQKRKDIDVQIVIFYNNNAYENIYPNIIPTWIPSWVKPSVFRKWSYNIEKLEKFICEYEPDVIHTHLFEAEFVTQMISYNKCKWFYHVHDKTRQYRNFSIKTLLNKQYFTEWYEKNKLFKQYKKHGNIHFITISTDTKRYFERNTRKYPIIYLSNAINYGRFYKKKEYLFDETLKLINVGSLIDVKNQAFLIKVAKVLKDKNVNFQLQILGEGNNRKLLECMIEEYDVKENVSLTGHVDNVSERLQISDIYVHSSTSEGLPLCLLEAMSAGLPVVSFNVDGCRDLIENGKNGYMVEANPTIYANKLLEIWDNKKLYAQLSQYAQIFACQYDIKKYVDELLDIYQNA